MKFFPKNMGQNDSHPLLIRRFISDFIFGLITPKSHYGNSFINRRNRESYTDRLSIIHRRKNSTLVRVYFSS